MLLGVELPPEFLAEIIRVVADAFEVVQVFRGDSFEYLPHSRHSEQWQAIPHARCIQA